MILLQISFHGIETLQNIQLEESYWNYEHSFNNEMLLSTVFNGGDFTINHFFLVNITGKESVI